MRRSGGMRRHLAVLVAAGTVLAGCGTPEPEPAPGGSDLPGRTIEVLAVWSDEEQASFERVLDVFEQRTGARVTYISGGDEVPTVLATRLTGGAPPGVAGIAPPPLVRAL